MINLLPLPEKKEVRSIYRARLSVALLAILAIVLCIAVALSLPSLFLSSLKRDEAQMRLAEVRGAARGSERSAFVADARRTLREEEILAEDDGGQGVTDLFSLVTSLKTPQIRIMGMYYQAPDGVAQLTVSGIANDRTSLIAFVDTLRAQELFAGAALPVSSLAKNRDIGFSVSIPLPRKE